MLYMNGRASGNSLSRISALGAGDGVVTSSLSLREGCGVLRLWFTRPR